MRSILGMFLIVCILISSCAVKYGITNLLNVQKTSKIHSSTAKDKFATTSSVSHCNFCNEKEIASKNTAKISVSDFQGLAAITFILLGGAFLLLNTQKHPVYGSSKIGNAIPIFLQYRKLII